MFAWTDWQTRSTAPMIAQWFGKQARNYWVMTGQMSKAVVIDCDNDAGDAYWHGVIANLDQTARVKTAKGYHYWFKIPDEYEARVKGWASGGGNSRKRDDAPSFDIRGDGGGVIAPPSIHESGHVYEWEVRWEDALQAPLALLNGTWEAEYRDASPGGPEGASEGGVSMLSYLLKNPNNEKRNDWLTKVAGHYAKQNKGQHDLYEVHVDAANLLLTPPLDDKERNKVKNSVWKGDQLRHPERAGHQGGPNPDNGYLVRDEQNRRLRTVAKSGRGEEAVFLLEDYCNFDLIALGRMVDDEDRVSYLLQIRTDERPDGVEVAIPGSQFGDDRVLRKTLASFNASVMPPAGMSPREGTPGVRLQRFIEAQKPETVRIVRVLGWDGTAGGFITYDGVITRDGLREGDQIVVDPALAHANTAKYEYGFRGTWPEAQEVLRDVLTFHEPDVMSVYGAWWAACFIKPQLMAKTALFPFMAIKSPSGSGKTNGGPDLLNQLNGGTRGEMNPTKAALRDMAAATRNGIVWIDDLDDSQFLMELLRAATSGGSMVKMGEDRTSVISARIEAPVVISGEDLAIGSQKALLDRALQLTMSRPDKRMSLKHPDRLQWDDIVELKERYPDTDGGLAAIAGHFVQQSLAVADQAAGLVKGLKGGVSGRAGDKAAILRTGARLLDHLLGHGGAWDGQGEHAVRVEAWLSADEQNTAEEGENSLTLELLPWALRQFKYPDKPYAADKQWDVDTPCYVKNLAMDEDTQEMLGEYGEVTIYFNTALLAQAWSREHRGAVQSRTQTAEALRQQADAMECPAQQVRIVGGDTRKAYYRKVSGEVARRVIERAQDA